MRRALLMLLLTLTLLTARHAGAPAAAGAPRDLSEGSFGQDVIELQRALKSLGFDPGPVDGVFGGLTAVALTSFQRSRGLTADGVAGPRTMASLSGEDAAQRPLAGRTIVIDPGHGGSNPGATGPLGTREADHALAVALDLEALLRSLGARVMMTRWKDTDSIPSPTSRSAELSARAGLANSARADLFVSIHSNSYEQDPSISGAMAFYDGAGEDRRLAATLLRNICRETGLDPLGLEQASFRVLVDSRVPSALVEVGFMSNPQDERMLASPSFREMVASGLVKGILEYLGAGVG